MPCVHCQRRGMASSCSFSGPASLLPFSATASSFAGQPVLHPQPEPASSINSSYSSSTLPAPDVAHSSRALTPETGGLINSPRVPGLDGKNGNTRYGKSSASTAISTTSTAGSATHSNKIRRHSSVDHATSCEKLQSYPPGGPKTLTRPRFLSNLRGEQGKAYFRPTPCLPYLMLSFPLLIFQVYIGQAASLSFLQLAREIVSEHIGPSEFSHNGKIQTMLETASPVSVEQRPGPALDVFLDVDQMLLYADAFNSAVGRAWKRSSAAVSAYQQVL